MDEEEDVVGVIESDTSNNITTKSNDEQVLGLLWNTKEDTLSLDLRKFCGKNSDVTTKRKILAAAHGIFDPIGFATPVTIVPKIMMKEAFRKKLNWDEPVPDDVAKKFKSWIESVKILSSLKLSRWILSNNATNKSLHIFSDASKEAYAAVAFLRSEDEDEVMVQLVMAKSRVSTIKPITIPKLELIGCECGAKMLNNIRDTINLSDVRIYLWTDSSNALGWIKRCENWQVFVYNRVKKIKELSNVEDWRHIPGNLNPADLPSRGCTPNQLIASKWWEGPEWLKKQKEFWPKSEINYDEEIVMAEVKKVVVSHVAQISDSSRLFRREDSMEFLTPILLPKNHFVVARFIRQEHERMNHAGIQTMMSYLREKYWVVHARATVRKVVHSCIKCRRHMAGPIQVPEAPLPSNRVRDSATFEICGIDLGGPLILRNKNKSWFVLFTCAVYRAMHLELLTSLTTAAFIQALRRFIARRGRSSTIYTDQGTNFKGTENLMDKLNWDEISSLTPRIRWIFNPPAAPWWGGWWERLVAMVKQLIRRILGQSVLDYEELMTILCDCEQVINSRPLTYLTEDVDDLMALTPMMFLNDLRSHGVADLDLIEADSFRKRFKYRQQIREDLRNRFRTEYLAYLVHQRNVHTINGNDLRVGDVVFIEGENSKRIFWPLGRITSLFPSSDGLSRCAKLQRSNGELMRPVQRLYPLETTDSEIPKLKIEEDIDQKNQKGKKKPNVQKKANGHKKKKPVVGVKMDEVVAPQIVTRSGRRIKEPDIFQC